MHRKNFYVIGILLISVLFMPSCSKEERQSKMAGVLAFAIPQLQKPFVVNQVNNLIFNKDSVPYTTNVRALAATFELTQGATLKVGDVEQVSGVTVNDFRKPVTYKVVAEDGKTIDYYTVRVVLTLDPIAVGWQKISAEGFGGFQDASAAVFLDRIYAAAYTLNSGSPNVWGIHYTGNGATWNRVKAADDNRDSIPMAAHGRLVTFGGKLWLLGGLQKDAVINKTWSTDDGLAWKRSDAGTSERWSPRERISALVFKDRLWVIGGSQYPTAGNPSQTGVALNDVWSTADGTVWTKATASAAFPARSNPAVFVYKNRMYLSGGIDNNKQYLNDIWYTEDGASWTQVNTPAPPPLRQGHKVLVNKNQLLLLGGADAGNVYGDLWVSADDGANWQQITNPEDSRALPEGFPKRAWFDAFASGKTIWILGGLDQANAPVKEVWLGRMN